MGSGVPHAPTVVGMEEALYTGTGQAAAPSPTHALC